ncbi:MAG: hypothetical protein OEW48_19620, partial [Phycisphaerae bacterium]|nr:hypothetical protein [Phycisphaerae bacterium]
PFEQAKNVRLHYEGIMAVLVRNGAEEMCGVRNLKGCVLMSIFLLGMACTAASGRTIYVDYDGLADFSNIQAAIDDSNDGDTIIVADGIYTGDGNRDIDFLGKAITLRSENGPENCIIDCNGTNTDPHRGFYFHNGEDSNSVLDGFTITNGLANDLIVPFGGAIHGNGTKATIQNNHIVGNVALTYNFFSGVRGGGLYDCDGTIQYNIISGNSAVNIDLLSLSTGGGLYGCDGTIKNNIISNNIADFGGGIEFRSSNPIISGCVFSGNIAYSQGGGVFCYGDSPTFINCTFNRNNATYHGGGFYNCSNIITILTNCTFIGNSATYGGGIFNYSDSELNLINCILWSNTPDQIYGDSPTLTYSDVQGVWPGLGNIDDDPCFADVKNGDYHLKSQAGRWEPSSQSWLEDNVTSPCIDAGNPMSPIGLEPFPNGGRINMGAYGGTTEASKSYFGQPVCETIVAGDINGDCKVNFLDFRIMAFHWLRDENK